MDKIAIIGGGSIGASLAKGLVESGNFKSSQLTVTKRKTSSLQWLVDMGVHVTSDNIEAVSEASIVILAVLPMQLNSVLEQIKSSIRPDHLVISVISGVKISDIEKKLGAVAITRAMPNTAISIRESMTCLAVNDNSKQHLQKTEEIFSSVGQVILINEDLMTSATALCACGIAFFLRAIRASSQGGVQAGFHAGEALRMAAQTAKGAASLLIEHNSHPEDEIDRVTSPEGCTIAGLNEMEHQGFSSAMIKGIVEASYKAGNLYKE